MSMVHWWNNTDMGEVQYFGVGGGGAIP